MCILHFHGCDLFRTGGSNLQPVGVEFQCHLVSGGFGSGCSPLAIVEGNSAGGRVLKPTHLPLTLDGLF